MLAATLVLFLGFQPTNTHIHFSVVAATHTHNKRVITIHAPIIATSGGRRQSVAQKNAAARSDGGGGRELVVAEKKQEGEGRLQQGKWRLLLHQKAEVSALVPGISDLPDGRIFDHDFASDRSDGSSSNSVEVVAEKTSKKMEAAEECG